MTTAIVVGASIAGLATARVLADHVDEVVLLERDDLSADTEAGPARARARVPQGRHVHVLLAAGLDRIRDWFPGLPDELEAAGAAPMDGSGWFFQAGGYRAMGDWGGSVLGMTRPFLERGIRRRVRALPNVTVLDDTTVDELTFDPTGIRVTGVRTGTDTRSADLVVDCSGRNSPLVRDLLESGRLVPPVTRFDVGIGYASQLLRRRPRDLDGPFLACAPSPPDHFRIGLALPVEDSRWQVTLGGMHGDVPPPDAEGCRAFAGTLLVPEVAAMLDACEPMSPVVTHRYPTAQRRHFEQVAAIPGFVVLGDAACSFDPIYGQGMTSAILQAETLGTALAKLGLGDDLPAAFHKRVARVIDAPWAIALGADYANPRTPGTPPRGTRLVNAWVDQVIHAGHTSEPVARVFTEVLNLRRPPTALFHPAVVARVAIAARRSPAARGPVQRQPMVRTSPPA